MTDRNSRLLLVAKYAFFLLLLTTFVELCRFALLHLLGLNLHFSRRDMGHQLLSGYAAVTGAYLMIGFGIWVHEYGHWWALRRRGFVCPIVQIGTRDPLFSVHYAGTEWAVYAGLFGGATREDVDQVNTARAAAFCALMGPVFGGIFSLLFCSLHMLPCSDSVHLWIDIVAGMSVCANVVQLIPWNPDGRLGKSDGWYVWCR